MSGYTLLLQGEVVAVVEQEGNFDASIHNASFTTSPQNIPWPEEVTHDENGDPLDVPYTPDSPIYFDTVIEDPELKFIVGEIYSQELYYEKYPRPIEELRRELLNKIDNESNEAIQSDFEYKGQMYQCKTTDLDNLVFKTLEVLLDPNLTTVIWIPLSNIPTQLTREEFIELGTQIGHRKESIIFQRRQMKDTVPLLTRQEIKDFDITYVY